jgi:hypothetical protein
MFTGLVFVRSASMSDALDFGDAEFAEEGLESLGGLVFLPGEFGVLVEGAP